MNAVLYNVKLCCLYLTSKLTTTYMAVKCWECSKRTRPVLTGNFSAVYRKFKCPLWSELYWSHSDNRHMSPVPQPGGALPEGDGQSGARAVWAGHHLLQWHRGLHHTVPLQHAHGSGRHAQRHLQELWQHPWPSWRLQGHFAFCFTSGQNPNKAKQTVYCPSGWDDWRCVHGRIGFAQTQRRPACGGHSWDGPGHAVFRQDIWIAAPAWHPSMDPYRGAFR